MYSSIPSSFQSSEFNINLPCDDVLWQAGSVGEWFETIYAPSPYGSGTPRIIGVDMESALASLGQIRLPTIPVSQNPFANFLLIHTLLGTSCSSPRSTSSLSGYQATSPVGSTSRQNGGQAERTLPAQYALHNWLQAWLCCPVHAPSTRRRDEPAFVLNALPFHWTREVSILARHTGGLNIGSSSVASEDVGVLLMSQWLEQIRSFLSNGEPIPGHLWNELIKIRMHISRVDTDCGSVGSDGLLAFLPGD